MSKRILCVILALMLILPLGVMPASAAEDKVVIVLDPGHGGSDGGTTRTYDGVEILESMLNLEIAKACRDYLLENFVNVQVYMTRETDKKVSLDNRVALAEKVGADFMLSIHINSDDGSARGALAIVPRGKYHPEQGKASLRTAQAIIGKMEELGMKIMDEGTMVQLGSDRYPDGTYVDAFAVIRGCVRRNIPCIIMEHGFLDNKYDYRDFMSTPEKLAALAEADALGLAETLGLQEQKRPLPFADVSEDAWYADAVRYVWKQGLMNGMDDGKFGPAIPTNRAMAVTLLYRMDGASLKPGSSTFADVKAGSWYHAPVEWALKCGITNGVSDTKFAPGRNVTREEFVTFLHRYAGNPEPTAFPKENPDWKKVSSYAQNAVAWAIEEGILNGYDDGAIKPQREVNRAELALMIQRFERWFAQVEKVTWSISHEDVTIKVGESFNLRVRSSEGETASVTWSANKPGYVTISGNKITGKAKGTVNVSCEYQGQTYKCIVRVK